MNLILISESIVSWNYFYKIIFIRIRNKNNKTNPKWIQKAEINRGTLPLSLIKA